MNNTSGPDGPDVFSVKLLIMSGFNEKVYELVMRIPEGKVYTYGRIAADIGIPGGARAVGNALHVNPYMGVVPCHRVVSSTGRTAEHFGFGGHTVQREMLLKENVPFLDERHVDLKACLWDGK